MLITTIFRKTLAFLYILGAMLGVTARGMAVLPSLAHSSAPPIVLEASPKELPNATNLYITVTGDNFAPTPTLTLGTVPLRDVTFVDGQTLTALVPWGLSPGSYSLTVVNPDGQSGAKENAILVYEEGNDWETNGPYGGFTEDVFIDPQNNTKIYASAGGSGLFVSSDAAENWQPTYLSTMLTELVFQYYNDERHLYMGKRHGDGLIHSANDGLTWEQFAPEEVGSWIGGYNFHPAWNPLEPHAIYLAVNSEPGTAVSGGLFKYSYLTGEWTKPYPHDLPVTSVAFSPDDPNRIYFGTREGQFYTSSDGGNTWADPVTVSNKIVKIVIDPFANSFGEHNIYATTTGWGYPGGDGSIFRSQDGGLTFQKIDNLPDPNAGVNSISIHPTIPGTIWLAGGRYRYFTTDNCQSWSPAMPEDIPYVWDFALQPDPSAPADPEQMTVYAATDGGVYKSVDGGQTWLASNQGLAGLMLGSLSVNPQNPDEAYASPVGMSTKFIKTIDGGRNWQHLDIPAPWVGWEGLIVVDPFTPNVVYFPAICVDPCVYISSDRGTTYQEEYLPRPEGVPADAIGNGVMVAPDPEQPGRLLAGAILVPSGDLENSYGVIYIRQSAAADWQIVKVLQGRLWRISFDPNNPQRVYAATNAGLYRSQDRGETWDRLTPDNLGGVRLVTVHPDHANVIYIHSQGIYNSRDDGATWEMLTDEYGNPVYGGPVGEMVFTPIGPRVFYIATWDGLFQSLDDGFTFTLAGGLPAGPAHSLAFGYDVGLSGQQRLVMYVGAAGGNRIIIPGLQTNMSQMTQTDLMSPGVYRRVVAFHHTYLPLVRR